MLCALLSFYPAEARGQGDARARLAGEMEAALRVHSLEVWYPRAVDSLHGGFLSRFDYRWQPEEPQHKMIVTQARHTWTAAHGAMFFPEARGRYLPVAAHGFRFLRDVMWDAEQGGFYDLVTREGTVIPEGTGEMLKRAYGQSFALYALAAYYAASQDTAALGLARRAFRWLDRHAHDPVHGGYFQFLRRDGTPYRAGYQGTPPKDQNSSIHLLEAFSELYRVWPDATLRARLQEMLHLVRDVMTDDRGTLRLFFESDWTPRSYRDSTAAVREANYRLDHVSFGHDVETAFLLLDAAESLGLADDTVTLRVAKKMVDHSLRTGWDEAVGGFYDMGYYLREDGPITIVRRTKTWWAQAEALNTLRLLADRYPDDPLAYEAKFLRQWAYVRANLIDAEHGGWYGGGLDEEPEYRKGLKGHIWKGAYHDARSLMATVRRLRAVPPDLRDR